MLKIGDKGDAVRELQEKLNEALLGKIVPLDEDGHFGELTELLVKSFQAETKGAIDGIAGPKTMQALNEAIQALKPEPVEDLRKRLECRLDGGHAQRDSSKQRGFDMRHYPILKLTNGINDLWYQIVKYLKVETSKRYKREPGKTWCNVYATDFMNFLWAYLPHFYWTKAALERILNGETVEAVYRETVGEYSANMLYEWLKKEGSLYHGWVKLDTAEQLQEAVNNGNAGLICAKRNKGQGSGHITVVLPETKEHKMINGIPVQSEAGGRNREVSSTKYFLNTSGKYEKVGFFVNYQPK